MGQIEQDHQQMREITMLYLQIFWDKNSIELSDWRILTYIIQDIWQDFTSQKKVMQDQVILSSNYLQ